METLSNLLYLVAAILFIFGLKNMAHPRTAVRGNLLGATGMLVAVAGAFVSMYGGGAQVGITFILIGIVAGAGVGGVFAYRVQMTQMPQLVALFNGFGGGASVFVAGAELLHKNPTTVDVAVAIGMSGLIGAITFFGSLVAFGKLQELDFFKKSIEVPYHHVVNGFLALLVLIFLAGLVYNCGPTQNDAGPEWSYASVFFYVVLVLFASALGFLLVNPIGGADMPVVIALLNSYSGLAAAATGFVLPNNVLIISGSLVGASGIILTTLMCKAMNRSLVNVLFGSMGGGAAVGDVDEIYANVRSTSADDVAMILETAQRVVFVPGYGMAVAQAQHAVRDLGNLLEEKGATVEYAIHPVAGRMPGHMNVLLAEADVDYEKLKEMDHINPTMETVDVAVIIGANDVVNPVARTDPQSPIAGMPIIDVDKARTVIVIKRSLSPGFAGIPNPLFAADNTLMLFGDGQQAVLDIVTAIKEG